MFAKRLSHSVWSAALVSLLAVSFTASCGGEPVEAPEAQVVAQPLLGGFSLKTYELANSTILSTRPQGTSLMVEHLNMALANNNILSATVGSLEERVLQPLAQAKLQPECPFLIPRTGQQTISCRYLVDQALDEALVQTPGMTDTIEQDLVRDHQADLEQQELSWVRGWVQESMMSGLNSGAVHAVESLRGQAVCDQAPTPEESAFELGVAQGKALLQDTEKEVLPTIPKTQCNTDVIAESILAAAEEKVDGLVQDTPLCEGFDPEDLSQAVDLSQAEFDREEGVNVGVDEAFEALRVRLVETWECQPPEPPAPATIPESAASGASAQSSGSTGMSVEEWAAAWAAAAGAAVGNTAGSTGSAGNGTSARGVSFEQAAENCQCWHVFVDEGPSDQRDYGIQCVAWADIAALSYQEKKTLAENAGINVANLSSESYRNLHPYYAQLPTRDDLSPTICGSGAKDAKIECGSPLVADLDGDGIQLSGQRVAFDLSASGNKVHIAALTGADALLALDLDGNGHIDSGAELFGNATACPAGRCTDGLRALAQHDSNGDQEINAQDSVFTRLRLWRDDNQDGTSQPGELKSLESAGISAIRLQARLDAAFADSQGNSAVRALTFVLDNGSEGLMPDVWFNVR